LAELINGKDVHLYVNCVLRLTNGALQIVKVWVTCVMQNNRTPASVTILFLHKLLLAICFI
jgi:hypothetical protein